MLLTVQMDAVLKISDNYHFINKLLVHFVFHKIALINKVKLR